MMSQTGTALRSLLRMLRLAIFGIILLRLADNERKRIAVSSLLLSDLVSGNSSKERSNSTEVAEPSIYRHASPAPFDASSRRTTIIKETAGTITLQDVCMRQLHPTGNIEVLSFRSDNDTENGAFVINKKLRKAQDYVLQTKQVSSAAEWEDITQKAEWILNRSIGEEEENNGVVWMYDWQLRNNPGHCLNDLSFSAALDLLGSNAESSEDDQEIRQPFYPLFIHANQTYIHSSCDTVCCQLFAERFGLIGYEGQISPFSDVRKPSDILTPLCFEQITFPKLEAARHVYNEDIYRGIRLLRERSFHMLGGVLDASPWPEESEDGVSSNGLATILLYDRSDASTRHLVDANEIKAELERLYQVKVDRVGGDDWSKANTTEQAAIYNDHQYILSPHGAHFININHSRPGTKVFEIQCYVNNRRWNLHQQWFAKWAHVIDVDWRVYTEMEGCIEDGQILITYSPKEVHVDVSKIVAEAANHFDLVPR